MPTLPSNCACLLHLFLIKINNFDIIFGSFYACLILLLKLLLLQKQRYYTIPDVSKCVLSVENEPLLLNCLARASRCLCKRQDCDLLGNLEFNSHLLQTGTLW